MVVAGQNGRHSSVVTHGRDSWLAAIGVGSVGRGTLEAIPTAALEAVAAIAAALSVSKASIVDTALHHLAAMDDAATATSRTTSTPS